MTIQEQKQKALELLPHIEREYDLSVQVKTIKLEDHADTEDLRDGFKLYYDLETGSLLFGRYWVENLTPGKKLYQETTLNPDELTRVIQWEDTQHE